MLYAAAWGFERDSRELSLYIEYFSCFISGVILQIYICVSTSHATVTTLEATFMHGPIDNRWNGLGQEIHSPEIVIRIPSS